MFGYLFITLKVWNVTFFHADSPPYISCPNTTDTKQKVKGRITMGEKKKGKHLNIKQ